MGLGVLVASNPGKALLMLSRKVTQKELTLPIIILFVTGFCLLGVLIVLKLLGNLTLSWGWVLSPIWLPGAIGWAIVMFVIFGAFIDGLARGIVAGYRRARGIHPKPPKNVKFDA